ncbi:PREDICTED: vanin-like protein 1 [Bactrocera latifrons]|uniref:Vanin-like protein 1 n=1 Tax=Bactrocera latifrons TaxID=174628 RepID=A0A0K8WEI4_BACLA|nr:PREDICTED: vanin-like protein 1 [Bactrocera latifrons]
MWLYKFLLYLACNNIYYATASGEPTPPDADYYIGAVVEFPARTLTAAAGTEERLRQFGELLESAAIRPDIVVFPEDVLNDCYTPIVVPAPSDDVIACNADEAHYNYIISRMSCYARSLGLYVLINVVEVHNCTQTQNLSDLVANCAIYNANVVFDRHGVVISRYRKYNLIGSEWLYFNYTSQPEQEAIFHTDFNVTFGHFTRMDLLYARPAQALVQRGITDFLHPSKWQSELPFLTAVQLHQSWSFGNNVNLLVAGTNDPSNGRSGTGIYAGKYGVLIATMTSVEKQSKLHLSVIPKHNASREKVLKIFKLNQSNLKAQPNNSSQSVLDRFTGVVLTRNNDIDLYVTQPLVGGSNTCGPLQQQLCHNDLCCNFYIEMHANPLANATTVSYYYRLAAFRDMGTFLNTEPDELAVCAIFACTGDHLYTCGRIYEEGVPVVPRYIFDTIRISGNFTRQRPCLLSPTSVDNLLMPLPVDEFQWQLQAHSNFTLANLTLLQPRSDLLTFGIYGNYFLDDTMYDHHHKDGASTLSAAMLLIFLLWKLQFYL